MTNNRGFSAEFDAPIARHLELEGKRGGEKNAENRIQFRFQYGCSFPRSKYKLYRPDKV